MDGEAFDTAALKGKVSLLVIWAGDAEHCLNAIKAGMDLAANHKGVAIYSINIDEKPDKTRIRNFLAKNKISVKTALDENGVVVDKLELEGVPMTFLIDKSGTVRKAFLGDHNDFKMLVGKEIAALQAEKK